MQSFLIHAALSSRIGIFISLARPLSSSVYSLRRLRQALLFRKLVSHVALHVSIASYVLLVPLLCRQSSRRRLSRPLHWRNSYRQFLRLLFVQAIGLRPFLTSWMIGIILGLGIVVPLAAWPARQLSNVDKGSTPSNAVTPVKATPSPVGLDSETDNTTITTGVLCLPPEATRQPPRSGNALVPFNCNFDTPGAHECPSTQSVVSSQSSSLPSLPPIVTPDGTSAHPVVSKSDGPLTTP